MSSATNKHISAFASARCWRRKEAGSEAALGLPAVTANVLKST